MVANSICKLTILSRQKGSFLFEEDFDYLIFNCILDISKQLWLVKNIISAHTKKLNLNYLAVSGLVPGEIKLPSPNLLLHFAVQPGCMGKSKNHEA